MSKRDYIALRNNDMEYFITGHCDEPDRIFSSCVEGNNIKLFEIMYKHYRCCVDLQKILHHAIEIGVKPIVEYLYNRDVMFSGDAVIMTTLWGNKEMLEWCLNNISTDVYIDKGQFANAYFKGGLMMKDEPELEMLINKVVYKRNYPC